MDNTRAIESTGKMTQNGGLLDYGPDRSRLLIHVMRILAHGRPVSHGQIDQMIADLEIARDDALQFLGEVAERDAGDNIVGIMGLSLNKTSHRLHVGGTRLSAWCAMDTLFLPALLGQTTTVVSKSPISGKAIRVVVGPRRVEQVNPADTVVSMVIVEAEKADVSSVEAIWATFCHHIHFFASRQEAEQWAGGRENIEILSVDEAFELGKLFSSRFLAHVK